MRDPLLVVTAVFGALGVGLGAFGAHGLRGRLGDSLSTWQTATEYHLVHVAALLGVVTLARMSGDVRILRVSGWAFVAGVFAFSGSLYWLALGGPRWLGPVTPLGGLAFIVGWLALAAYGVRHGSNRTIG